MAIKLIMVCKDGPAKQAYLRETASIGIEADTVETFGDLCKSMISKAYQGVMIDVITSLKASREEKGMAQGILDVFPLIQLKWDAETNRIHTISTGAARQNGTLAHFVAQECQIFKPRSVRLDVRKNVNFNILLNKQPDMTQISAERSVTINISRGGCFLFSCQDWTHPSDAWFVINELSDKTPILGEIRWRQAWGKAMAIPGIGVHIVQITSRQKDQLAEKFGLS